MKPHLLSQETVLSCKKRLLSIKQDLLNRVRASAQQYSVLQASRETSGDEIDQSVAQIEENGFLLNQERMRQQLLEIEMALSRIENGTFGMCEETEEVIEVERLMAVPWTRLSIEGAEIREALHRKFAR
jgi:DnaK suppressor protein